MSNEHRREKIFLNGYETWLDRSGYPSIWLYYSATAENGIAVDVLYGGRELCSSRLTDTEKRDLLGYLNCTNQTPSSLNTNADHRRKLLNELVNENRMSYFLLGFSTGVVFMTILHLLFDS